MTGPAEREVDRLGMVCAAVIRPAVVAVASIVTASTTTAREPVLTVFVVVLCNLWHLAFGAMLLRRAGRAPLLIDVLVMCAVCFAQVWTAVPAMHTDRMSWVLVAASSAVVAYQFHTSPLTGALAMMAVTAGYLAGSGLAGSQPWSLVLPFGLWLAVEGASARGLSWLVHREARAADRIVAEAERVRRSTAVADARRADEREYLAALHDTASATLLMVGSGVVARRETWLCEQAARDLDVILGRTGQVDGELDLVVLLRDVVERVPLRIGWRSVESLPVPAVVAVALGHSTREALTNVVRHAGVDAAEVVVVRRGTTVVIEVRDEGRGFDPDQVSGHSHGVTRSLVQRMAAMGGHARVESAPGRGTVVRMEWPDERS